ncbi:MAG: hypothetical protein ACK5IQ_09785 [Bacteroidales bacterium]
MKYIPLFIVIFCVSLLSSCSLLEFSLKGEAEPLSKQELSTRFAVRTFYSGFVSKIIVAADSMVISTDSAAYKTNAIRWKLNASNSCASLAYQSSSDIAMVGTWIFCERMNNFLQSRRSDSLFGTYNASLAAQAGQYGVDKITKVARAVYDKGKQYEKVGEFVRLFAKEHPFTSLSFDNIGFVDDYQSFLSIPDSLMVHNYGTAPEILGDFADRMGTYTEQFHNNLTWNKDMLEVYWDSDSMTAKFLVRADTFAAEFMTRADSITALLAAFSEIAKNSPELAAQMAANVSQELRPMIDEMNYMVNTSFLQFSQQRDSIQLFLDQQRVALKDDISETGVLWMEQMSDSLASFVKKISFAVGLLAVVLVLVIFGVPFALGYYTSKLRSKVKDRNLNRGD